MIKGSRREAKEKVISTKRRRLDKSNAIKKAVGIAISRDRLAIIAGRLTGSNLILLDANSSFFTTNESNNMDANVMSSAELQAFILRNRVRNWPAIISIPNDRVIVRYMKMPVVPDEALRQMVSIEIGNTIHLPFEDPVFDVISVKPLSELEEGMQSIVLIAAPKNLILEMVDIVKNVGLKPIAIDLEPIALWRYARRNLIDLAGLTVLIDLREQLISFSIFLDDSLYFLREVDGDFTFDLTNSEGNIATIINDINYELNRVMNFFNFSLAGTTLSANQILLYTYFEDAIDVANALANQLGITVIAMSVKDRLRQPSWVSQPFENRVMGAIGLLLRGRV